MKVVHVVGIQSSLGRLARRSHNMLTPLGLRHNQHSNLDAGEHAAQDNESVDGRLAVGGFAQALKSKSLARSRLTPKALERQRPIGKVQL